ncbi:MAG: hypothetical protein ACYC1Z_03570 [Georgenia sp.]
MNWTPKLRPALAAPSPLSLNLARIDERARQAQSVGGLDLIHVHYPADVRALMLALARRDAEVEQLRAERDTARAQLNGIGDTLAVIAGTLGSAA